MDPHDPYFAHPYDGTAVARVANQHPDPSQAEQMHRLYAGEIAYLDEHFGRLLAKLREQGRYDQTVIALVADHGEEFQDHGGWWHGLTLYDEQIHVPLLIKWARNDAPIRGDQRGEPARLIDVAPTLLARAGAAPPAAMQGRDLAALPPARRAAPDRLVFAEEDHEGNVLRAVRTREWKWIEANAGNPRGLPPEQLFQLEQDPGERSDLREAHPERVAELREQAAAQELRAGQVGPGEGGPAAISESQRAALEALGYLGEDAEKAAE
jgi:arylsulfatase A-like enzyme